MTVQERLAWIEVQSSNLVAVAYQPDTKRLVVRFRNGNMYAYEDVPLKVYEGLLTAPSAGQYLNAVLKPRYKAIRLGVSR